MATVSNFNLFGQNSTPITGIVLESGANTLIYERGMRQTLSIRNPTGSPISPVISGSASGIVRGYGGVSVNTAAGLTIGPIAAGDTKSVVLDDIFEYLRGAVSITNATGCIAHTVGYGISNVAGGATLTAVSVMVWAGQSQIGGARSVKADITGYVGLATDSNAFIWDCPSQTIVTLVPGSAELQPSLALMDPAYTDTVGPLGEFNRFFRRDNPSTPIYHFKYAVGGSRFTSAGSLGVPSNWAAGVSGGARESMLSNWTAFVAALAAQSKYPVVTWMATDLGYSSGTDSTESTNYQADMTALIAWWRTNIIGSTARLTIARACGTITGFTFLSTIRTAQANIRTAATPLVELMDTDDFELVADNVHFSAASHMHHGERLYCHYANRWYPAVDRVNGATLFPTDFYRLGDLRNTYVGALKTGNISDLWDGVRGRTSPITFTQATDANRPAINTETLGGLSVRNGRFNGTTSRMQRNTGRMAGASPWGLCYALRVATPAGPAAPIGEGLSSGANPFVSLRTDTDTYMEAFMRDTSGVVITGPFDYATANAAGDVMRAFSLSYDGTNIQGQTDGTLGGSNAFPLSGITASDRVSFGCVIYGGGNLHFADTDIAEVWWTNGALDATYRAKALSYMQWRWGTP